MEGSYKRTPIGVYFGLRFRFESFSLDYLPKRSCAVLVRIRRGPDCLMFVFIETRVPYTVIPRLTKIIRSGITFVSRNLR